MEGQGLVRGEIPGRWLSVNVLGFAKARLRNRPADLKNTSRTIPLPQRCFHPSTQGTFFCNPVEPPPRYSCCTLNIPCSILKNTSALKKFMYEECR